MRRTAEQQKRSLAQALSVAAWAAGIGVGVAFLSFLNLTGLLHGLWSGVEDRPEAFAATSDWSAFATACVCALLMICAARLMSLLEGALRVVVAFAGFSAFAGLTAMGWQLAGASPEMMPFAPAEALWILGTAVAPLLLSLVGLGYARAGSWPAWLVAAPLLAARITLLFGERLRPDSEWEILRSSHVIIAVHATSAMGAILLAYSARRVRLSPRPGLPIAGAADALWVMWTLLICRALLFIAPGPVSLFFPGYTITGTWIREWFLRSDAAMDLGLALSFVLLAVQVRRAGQSARPCLIAFALCVVAAFGEQLAAENQPMFVLDRIFDVHLSWKVELWLCGAAELLTLGIGPCFALYAISQEWAAEMEAVPTSTFWWLLAGGVAGLFKAAAALNGGVVTPVTAWVLTFFLVGGLWRFRRLVPALDGGGSARMAALAEPARASPP